MKKLVVVKKSKYFSDPGAPWYYPYTYLYQLRQLQSVYIYFPWTFMQFRVKRISFYVFSLSGSEKMTKIQNRHSLKMKVVLSEFFPTEWNERMKSKNGIPNHDIECWVVGTMESMRQTFQFIIKQIIKNEWISIHHLT